MTTATRAVTAIPAGEIGAWAIAMAESYAAAHPGVLARLAGIERADTRAHQTREEHRMSDDEFGKAIELSIEQGHTCIARSEAVEAAMETGHWWQAGWRRRNTRRRGEIRQLRDQTDEIIHANDRRLAAGWARLRRQQEQIRVNDLGGQDPYPRYGADASDLDEEACDG